MPHRDWTLGLTRCGYPASAQATQSQFSSDRPSSAGSHAAERVCAHQASITSPKLSAA